MPPVNLVTEPVPEFGSRTPTLPHGGYPGVASPRCFHTPCFTRAALRLGLCSVWEGGAGAGHLRAPPPPSLLKPSRKPSSQPDGFLSSVLVTGQKRGTAESQPPPPATPLPQDGHQFPSPSPPLPVGAPPPQGLALGLLGRPCSQGTKHLECTPADFPLRKARSTPKHKPDHHLKGLTLYFIDVFRKAGTYKFNVILVHIHICVPTLAEGRDDLGVQRSGREGGGKETGKQSGTEGGLLRSILLTNMKPGAPREHG